MFKIKNYLYVFLAFLMMLCAVTACSESSSALPEQENITPTATLLPTSIPTPTSTPDPSPTSSPMPSPTPEPIVIKVQLAGDILLHPDVVASANIGGNEYNFTPYFEHIKPYINGDLAIFNMESPVDAFGENSNLSGYPQFNIPYQILDAAKDMGFNYAVTVNNHAFDKGHRGVESTLEHIKRVGLEAIGTYEGIESLETPQIFDIGGISVGIVAYVDNFREQSKVTATDKTDYYMRGFSSYRLDDLPRMEDDVKALRNAGAELVIVSLHWGAEYVDEPTKNQRTYAEALCDAGADVIMGHHSHCVQPVEWYTSERDAECLIIYSLGNFFANQIGMQIPKTQYSMLVEFSVTKPYEEQISLGDLNIIPTLSYRGGPHGTDHFRLIPLDNIDTDERPERFYDNAAWEWGKRALAHVSEITGLTAE